MRKKEMVLSVGRGKGRKWLTVRDEDFMEELRRETDGKVNAGGVLAMKGLQERVGMVVIDSIAKCLP
jgi:hypothetical protein